MTSIRKRLSYANVMSSLAVFLVLTGATAFAAAQLAKNSVGAKQLKKNAVRTAKIKNAAVTTDKIADGAVIAAKLADGSVLTAKIVDGAVTSAKLAGSSVTAAKLADNAVTTGKIADLAVTTGKIGNEAVTGPKVNEATLGEVPLAANALKLEGKPASSFLSSSVYKTESPVGPGTALGASHFIDHACNPGDVMLSGGPANIADTSILLESFPAPGSNTTWRARINKKGETDNFSVVVLCIDQ